MPPKTYKKTSKDSPRLVKNRSVMVNAILDRYYARLSALQALADREHWGAVELSRQRTLVHERLNTVRNAYPEQWMAYHGLTA